MTLAQGARPVADPVRPFDYRPAREAGARWAALPVQERVRRLEPLVDRLREQTADLAALVAGENGKPYVEAVTHEVGASIANLRFLLRVAPGVLAPRRIGLRLMPHRVATLTRKPHGVVLIISPWNFPLAIPFSQVLAALIAGNAVVLKPSEATPRTGARIGALLAGLDLPEHLVTVVQGDGAVGAQLIAQRPDKILFTGSVPTGRRVMQAAAEHPIPVSLELGGVDALLVLDDADLERATSAAAWGLAFNGGQVCASVERILVHESMADVFAERLAQKLRSLDPAQDLGRITVARQKDIYRRHLDDARARGLTVEGGEAVGEDRMRPALVRGAGIEDAQVYREETFGPIAAVATFRTDDEAVALHNALPFGLTASVFTASKGRGVAIADRLVAGVVSINDVAATLHAFGEIPWGGAGESGFGRSHGEEGLLDLTRCHVVERNRAWVPDFKRPWWFPYDIFQQRTLEAFTELSAARGLGSGLRAGVRLGRAALVSLVQRPRL